MTPRLIRITAKDLIRILRQHGYDFVRTKGSHQHFVHSTTGIRLTVPVHSGRIIGPGLLSSILKQARISPSALMKRKV